MADMDCKIFHERQSLQRCAIHAVNNLFQDKDACSKEIIDSMCYELAPRSLINPHKSMIGLGNYDVNVLMALLETKGYDLVWFDKRRGLDCINFENVFGVMINVPSDWEVFGRKLPFANFKHWFTVRSIQGQYYNLDSKLNNPVILGSEEYMKKFVASLLQKGSAELLLVVENVISLAEGWKGRDY